MDEVREVLVGAKELLERGWNQGGYTDGRGNYCVRAAIGVAAGYMTFRHGEVDFNLPTRNFADKAKLDMAACRMVNTFIPVKHWSVPFWNDHPETTHNDVLQVMDKAISAC